MSDSYDDLVKLIKRFSRVDQRQFILEICKKHMQCSIYEHGEKTCADLIIEEALRRGSHLL